MRPVPGRELMEGPWFKGNLHLHSTRSDGGKDYRTVARLYAERGYDFIFITDHHIAADIESLHSLPLLALNGAEVSGRDRNGASYHVLALGCDAPLPETDSFDDLLLELKDRDALLALAHPHWMGNSVGDALRHPFDGVEMYNHICRYLNGKGYSGFHWDRMLERDPLSLGLAVDDAHLNGNEPWDGGWVMVCASELTKTAVIEAIRAGRFYSSLGPTFDSIRVDESGIHLRTSPVVAVRLVDNTSWGARVYPGYGQTVTEAEFSLPAGRPFVRVEIEDERGRKAWTNALLVSET
ncbi:MAG: hypothetical protein R6X33_18980 [Candidatus Brocadiia bacterium]